MTRDEQAVRDLIAEWQRATAADDVDTVLSLMSDDVLFLTPGQEPFGKEVFASASRERTGDVHVEGTSEIEELEVFGDRAWVRTRITVTMTPSEGEPVRRSGHTLSIMRKNADGSWVLARDANLLPPPSS
jgi:uncharacterized protein (TIGR02246 family)